uniref:Golgi SNAP receptor complex member 1 n=1 Tax=Oryza nivara TaxID=4536 RepID=A0A0E0G0H7_ORYNI
MFHLSRPTPRSDGPYASAESHLRINREAGGIAEAGGSRSRIGPDLAGDDAVGVGRGGGGGGAGAAGVRLSSYARLAARSSSAADAASASSPSERSSWKSMEFEIQSLLDKLQDVNDAMSRCAASTAPTTSVSQKLARHRDILHEFAQEFRRTRGNLSSIREHADLLSSVRDDITESKATGGMSPRVHLLRERASIHGSINQIDEVIGQAQSTRVALSNQRALFGDVQGKVKQLGEKFPVIRGLLGAIKRKKSKDTIILSAVIAACTIFLIIYWLSK